jgi:hypothetical protein
MRADFLHQHPALAEAGLTGKSAQDIRQLRRQPEALTPKEPLRLWHAGGTCDCSDLDAELVYRLRTDFFNADYRTRS